MARVVAARVRAWVGGGKAAEATEEVGEGREAGGGWEALQA